MIEENIESVDRQCSGKFIGPFNRRNGCFIEILIETDCAHLRFGSESVEVCMDKRQTAMVLMNENESGTCDSGVFGIEAFSYPSNKGGLSGTQVSAQSQNLPPC